MKMKRYKQYILIVSAIFLGGGGFLPSVWGENFFDAKVQKVLDGDKILLRGGTIVQYMGIDTPRTRVPYQIFQDIAVASLKLNKRLVEGKTVRLEIVTPSNISSEDSRKFAYVFIGGQMVNALLLKKGLAVVSRTYPPDVKYQNFFLQSQQQAIMGKIGIWQKLQPQEQAGSVSDHAFR